MRPFILLVLSLSTLAAPALAAPSSDDEVLAHARQKQLEFRQGNYAVATPLVTTLEDAVKRSPRNAALWEALGHACMSKSGAALGSPPDIPSLLAITRRARDAYARALELDPNNMLVLSGHGMSRLVVGQFEGDPAGIAAGTAEMNDAVRRAPKSIAVRLTRAFTIVHFPPAMRDNDALIDDLKYILDNASGGRPEDVVHVMLGDVYAEMGKPDAARAEYGQVTGASSFAAQHVKLRLADLAKGAIAPASIVEVRAGTGSNCAMCHAPGIDN